MYLALLDTAAICIDICFVDDNTGWVTKNGTGKLLKSTNGGLNWTPLPSNISDYIGRIQFFDENTGWTVSGNYAYKTTNGGVNWTGKVISNEGPINCIDFINQNTGWAVGEHGLIYKTTNGGLIPVANISTEIPESFVLYQNYPNPFNPITKIKFEIPLLRGVSEGRGVSARLTIYDVLGREIASLIPPLWGGQEGLKPGTYEVEWNASNFPSGVYFYKLETERYSESKKMILIK